ncbi:hypothetical protein KCP76_06730 [Salmonella enterica subsp. enterica serovar Weltevreden]|nr:hypothetical protein KCP76_06730 [Salmonella enterica subsp. enterica serovar Weltevreden]
MLPMSAIYPIDVPVMEKVGLSVAVADAHPPLIPALTTCDAHCRRARRGT